MEVKPGLGARAPPLQVARGLDVVVQGAQERFLAVEGPPGSFLLTSSVLERTLRKWYRRNAYWYIAARSEAPRWRSSPSIRSIPRMASCCISSNAKTRAERCLIS